MKNHKAHMICFADLSKIYIFANNNQCCPWQTMGESQNPPISVEIDRGGEPKTHRRYPHGQYLTTLITVKSMVSIPEPVHC